MCTVLFTVEYTLRLWASIEDPNYSHHAVWGRLKWASKPLALLDLAALAPYFLEVRAPSVFEVGEGARAHARARTCRHTLRATAAPAHRYATRL
jgi:hypothetical protein